MNDRLERRKLTQHITGSETLSFGPVIKVEAATTSISDRARRSSHAFQASHRAKQHSHNGGHLHCTASSLGHFLFFMCQKQKQKQTVWGMRSRSKKVWTTVCGFLCGLMIRIKKIINNKVEVALSMWNNLKFQWKSQAKSTNLNRLRNSGHGSV